MGAQKGTTWFHNSETGERKPFKEDPGPPWIKGRGSRYYNPETGQIIFRGEDPGESWVQGASGNLPPSLKGTTWYHNPLTGETQMSFTPPELPWKEGRGPRYASIWVEGNSRTFCRRWNCDCIYILKMTTRDGIVFGKWGSSRESSFKKRGEEFKTKHISFELVHWQWFGEKTEDVEAFLGRKLSRYPPRGVPKFCGYTETFEWTATTQKLLEEIIYDLEESPPP